MEKIQRRQPLADLSTKSTGKKRMINISEVIYEAGHFKGQIESSN